MTTANPTNTTCQPVDLATLADQMQARADFYAQEYADLLAEGTDDTDELQFCLDMHVELESKARAMLYRATFC